MNFKELFEIQQNLDQHILNKKGLVNTQVFHEKVLALLVELGELANDWRGFKYWSENRKPKETMLEEYVDCLHFILSIGNDLLYQNVEIDDEPLNTTTTQTFVILNKYVSTLSFTALYNHYDNKNKEGLYSNIFNLFIKLGKEKLGFTPEQIKRAYLDKNKENHNRQENGY